MTIFDYRRAYRKELDERSLNFALIMASSGWQPNINAKPFVPSSAAYVLQLPCCAHPLKIKRRGVIGRLLQVVLLSVLVVTIVFNVIFIIDSSKRYRKPDQGSPYPYDDSDEVVNANIMLEQKEQVEGKKFVKELCFSTIQA